MTNKITVLITPAGSGMAIVALKALRKEPSIKIVGADINPLAAGLHLAHKGYLVPPISDPTFFSRLDKIIGKENINVIFPCLDTFLLPFAEKRKAFQDVGISIVVSPEKTIEICRDKWRLYNLLKDDIPVPESTIHFDDVDEACNYVGLPAILKPRSGSGSRNIYAVQSREDLSFYLKKIDEPILQRQIHGVEYTVDMLVDKGGKALAVVPRKRIEVKAGISVKGATEFNSPLIEIGQKLSKILRFFGPINFQAVIDEKSKVPKVTEINPRISGGMSLTVASGVNIPLLSVYLALEKPIEFASPQKHQIFMSRYFEEIVLTQESIENLEKLNDSNSVS